MLEKILYIERLARQLLDQHGLQDWQFKLCSSKHRVAVCKHGLKRIEYSTHYLAKTSEEKIKDTILHEIAHALVGKGHGHDASWRLKCLEIGARPERLAGEETVTTAKPNYIIECSGCGQRWKRYRLRKKYLQGPRFSICCQAELKFYKVKTK